MEITDDLTVRKLEVMNERISEAPKHRRKMIWGKEDDPCSKTVKWTEYAEPLPRPPLREFENEEALHTISSHPDLFAVSTPINIDRFEALLAEHPNQPFVQSVCQGLREGFWPFADTHYGEWPTTWDFSQQPVKSQSERDFISSQIEKEVSVGRYSPAFGPDLLPGMYSMPIHAVPKPGSDKLRLVTNHSASDFALNNMISKDDIAGVTLDNVQDLANALRLYRRKGGENEDLIVWKADVSEAYRHMPMHPLWQIKQVVTFEGQRHVDQRNVFGGRASQRIFHAFMSLVTWIAVMKLLLYFLRIYVDDSFSFQRRQLLSWYAPYQKLLPSDLVTVLKLWDHLSLPHEARKQVYGTELPIIGFDVHSNLMRIRMSDESRIKLVQSLQEFGQHGARRTLRDFQHIAGHLNWALNVNPMLQPGLCAIYRKTAGKLHQRALIWINRDVERELEWARRHLEESDGIFIVKSISWDYPQLPETAFRVYCDASSIALAFWFPSTNEGFQFDLGSHDPPKTIFYNEALTVCSAIHHAISRVSIGGQLAVFTDNLNTVQMFNSLAALPALNWMLIAVVDLLLSHDVDLRVFHVSGVYNVVADHLSRLRNKEANQCAPNISLHPFQPPRNALGAAQK